MAELSKEQRILQLAALLSSGGWKLFEKDLKERLECAQAGVDSETMHFITDPSKLNLAISQRNGIAYVYNIIQEYRDELEDTSPDEA